jgi:hypothetical protein
MIPLASVRDDRGSGFCDVFLTVTVASIVFLESAPQSAANAFPVPMTAVAPSKTIWTSEIARIVVIRKAVLAFSFRSGTELFGSTLTADVTCTPSGTVRQPSTMRTRPPRRPVATTRWSTFALVGRRVVLGPCRAVLFGRTKATSPGSVLREKFDAADRRRCPGDDENKIRGRLHRSGLPSYAHVQVGARHDVDREVVGVIVVPACAFRHRVVRIYHGRQRERLRSPADRRRRGGGDAKCLLAVPAQTGHRARSDVPIEGAFRTGQRREAHRKIDAVTSTLLASPERMLETVTTNATFVQVGISGMAPALAISTVRSRPQYPQ